MRRTLAAYLRVSRSVPLDKDQVIITSGTQQSLELCAQLLADHGDTVWMEDPAYWGAVKAFMATGLNAHGVPVDADGMAPSAADERHPPRLIYTTPSHQYPTGAVMSLARRQQLLALAQKHQAWVLEDDYDSEFRFSGPPISSLAGLAPDERVLYLGSFSKVLYPGLKLGYLVVPKALVSAFRQAHYDLNRPGQMPLQAALAEFIELGHFASALAQSPQQLRTTARSTVAGPATVSGPEVPSSVVLNKVCICAFDCRHRWTIRHLALKIATLGMTVRALSAYCLQRNDVKGVVVGYGYAPLTSITRWGPTLANAISAALPSPTVPAKLQHVFKTMVQHAQHQAGRTQQCATGKRSVL